MDALFALVLAASFGALTVALLFDVNSEPYVGGAPATREGVRAAVVAAIAAGHAAVAFRRVFPTIAFVVISSAVGIQVLNSVWWLLPSWAMFLVALYSFTAYGRRFAPTIGLVTGLVGAAVVTAAGFALTDSPWGPSQWFTHVTVRLLPFVIAAWSLGMFRRIRLAYVAALEDRAVRAEAEREERARRAVADERARIAREMHDVVAHALSVMISQANGGRYAARAEPAEAIEALTTISRTGRQALGDMRGLLHVLRTGARDDDRFPHPALTDLPDLLESVRAAGVPVEFEERDTSTADEIRLSPSAEVAAFRVIQEALTNTLKHGGAGAQAWVRLVWSDEVATITVRDNGVGDSGPEGQGLIGMRERLAVVDGRMQAGANPEGGFVVEAWVPTTAEGE